MNILANLNGEPMLEKLNPYHFILIQVLIIFLILMTRTIAKTIYKLVERILNSRAKNSNQY
jgi:hypothetical protein